MKTKIDLLLDLKQWLLFKSEQQSNPMKERCLETARLCQQLTDELTAIWEEVKTTEKRVGPVNLPFHCQRCGTYMETGTLRTAIWQGDKYVLPDGSEDWKELDITFLCPKCQPIP